MSANHRPPLPRYGHRRYHPPCTAHPAQIKKNLKPPPPRSVEPRADIKPDTPRIPSRDNMAMSALRAKLWEIHEDVLTTLATQKDKILSYTETKVVLRFKLNRTSLIKIVLRRHERGYDDGELIHYEAHKSGIVLNGTYYPIKSDEAEMEFDEDNGDRNFVMRWNHYTKDDNNFQIVIDAKNIAAKATIICLINGTECDMAEIGAEKTIAHLRDVLDSQLEDEDE